MLLAPTMSTLPSIGVVATAVAAILVGLAKPTAPAASTPGRIAVSAVADGQDPAPAKQPGHLVLVVEGNVLDLHITCAVAKPSPWAGVPKGLQSEFALLAFDAAGKEQMRVPLDLSCFETDPAKIHQPVVVTGCEVRSPDIGVLVNIPVVDGAVRYAIVRGNATIGTATAAELGELLRRPR